MELFSPGHLVVLAIVVAFLFFGWKQLPDMSRSLGRSLRVFKTEIKGLNQDDKVRDEHERAAADQPKALDPAPAPARAQVVTPGSSPRPRPTPGPTTPVQTRSPGQ